MTDLTSAQTAFITSVLALRPRTVAFDCDGTLWSGDAGFGFFFWELEQGLVSEEIQRWARERYDGYLAGRVPEEVMCGEMATMHHGMQEEAVQQAADAYFPQGIAANIFPEMRELVLRLRTAGCEVWAVSSSNQWIIRAGMRYFDIPPSRILTAEAVVENGLVADRLVRVPSGPGKPQALRDVLAQPPDCAFGNSIWDREMLQMVEHPFVINPNPNLKDVAVASGWPIYQPEPNHRGREL